MSAPHLLEAACARRFAKFASGRELRGAIIPGLSVVRDRALEALFLHDRGVHDPCRGRGDVLRSAAAANVEAREAHRDPRATDLAAGREGDGGELLEGDGVLRLLDL